MKKNFMFGTLTLLTVAVLGVGFVGAYGLGPGKNKLTDDERFAIQERQAAMQDAIETNDYAEWEGLMLERIAEMEDSINEDTFNELVQRHQGMEEFRDAMNNLKESGNFSYYDVEALREKYGVENMGRQRTMHGNGMATPEFAEGKFGHGMDRGSIF